MEELKVLTLSLEENKSDIVFQEKAMEKTLNIIVKTIFTEEDIQWITNKANEGNSSAQSIIGLIYHIGRESDSLKRNYVGDLIILYFLFLKINL